MNADLSRHPRLVEFVRLKYNHGDPSHDFNHVKRVVASCIRLGTPLGANLRRLIPAALLHDVIHVPKNSPNRLEASALASEEAKIILKGFADEIALTDDDMQAIATIILEHSYSLGKKPTSLESAILQDADKLDGLGALGIARTFACCAVMGGAFYDSASPFPAEFDASGSRALDDKLFCVDHFYTKLFKLSGLMNTEAGRQEAETRAAFMQLYLEQFQNELDFGSTTQA